MRFTTRIIHGLTILRRNAIAFTALAAAAPLLAAAPAHADNNKCATVIVSNGGLSVAYHQDDCCKPGGAWATREFDRGQRTGRDEGFDSGFRDGLRGGCLDHRITLDFCHLSRPFEDGYRSTYKCAYEDGFEKGRCERLARIERERRERECCRAPIRGWGWGSPWRR